MKKTISIICVFCLVLAMSAVASARALPKPESKNAEAQKFIDQAWKIYKTESTAEGYKKAAELMEEANKLDPKNPAILTDISRYYWNWGDNLPKETKDQKSKLEDIYEKGLDYAEQSIKVKETAGGHYWAAVNKAASLEFSMIVTQAAGFPSIYGHSDYVTKNDPDYYYGAAGRLWSEVLTRVPKAVVELVGWDVQEAIDQIDAAIKKFPNYFDNYVYKARFYFVYFGDKQQPLEWIDHVLKQDPNVLPGEELANKTAQNDAKILWKKITGKDYPNK